MDKISQNGSPIRLERYLKALGRIRPTRLGGRVSQVVGVIVESVGPMMNIGDVGWIVSKDGQNRILAEVVGLRGNKILLMPFGPIAGISAESEVIAGSEPVSVPVGEHLLGRILDGMGRPIDSKGPLIVSERRAIHSDPPDPMKRKRIEKPIATGIRAIDGMLTCGEGQRVGIFAGSGVGKSVLLGMIARNTEADVNVIALIGERGREVREFIERDLGPEGLARSVVVVVTSDQSAILRIKGAMAATSIAEYFRDQGRRVMLMMDSVTRFAMAQREIGLAVGEPPTTKGYTPSVFSLLPKLLERAGTGERGSITGLYTVLVESDDMNDPVADSVRSILDGHIVLSRKLAAMNHYPAIDVLESVSRVMNDIVPQDHKSAAGAAGEILATYRESEDLINIGAYVKGSNPKIDRAIEQIDPVNTFLCQAIEESTSYDVTISGLTDLFSSAK
ncbi:flagellar protein export ATPase FliI [bacterium]|nr:flagellar protein export ATPase FliI [bacterium]